MTLDTPLALGPVTLRNRLVFAAHLTNFAVDGLPTRRHAAYYGARAAGGAGLVITEEHSVHPDDRPYEKLIRGHDPAVLPGYREITDAVHAHGSVVLAQLNHNGAQSWGRYSRRPVAAPSAVPDPLFREVPVALTPAGITELVAAYADVAARCAEGGFDGVELQCSQSSIVRQFLSPATNRRVDGYGGPPANRVRFLLELLEAVRAALGPDRVLGVRLGCDELNKVDELAEIAKLVAGTGHADYLNSTVGVAGTSQHLITPPMGVPAGYALPVAATLRRATGLPVLGIGRFTTVAQIEQVLADEACDLVGAVRGQLADPDLGRTERATPPRTCLGCNQECVGRVGRNHAIACTVNPGAGREGLPLLPVVPAGGGRRVLVVGGGPAGLRAAATAAGRGHRVTLCEASGELGGQLLVAALGPGRDELAPAVTDLAAACAAAGVDVRLNTTVDHDFVTGFGADAVVLATGSRAARPGWAVPGVWDVREVLDERCTPSGSILVYDELGDHQAASTALALAARGAAVRLMTPAMVAAQELGTTLDREWFRRRCHELGIRTVTDRVVLAAIPTRQHLDGVIRQRVAVRSLHHPTGRIEAREYDAVVCARPALPHDPLSAELRDTDLEIHRVGDCVAPRELGAAIDEGHRAGSAV